MAVARDLTRDVVRGLATFELEFFASSDLPWLQLSDSTAQQPPAAVSFSYADCVLPTFLFLSGITPTRAWYRSVGLVGLGLGFNTLSTIDLEETIDAAKGRHHSIQRRQRRRERMERRERRMSRGLADSLLSVDGEDAMDEDEDEAVGSAEEDEKEEEEEEQRRLIPKFLRLPGVLQRTGLSTLVFHACYTASPAWTSSWWFPGTVGAAWAAITILGSSSPSWRRPFADPQKTAQTRLDVALFGAHRLASAANDPEGLLTVLSGCLTLWSGLKFEAAALSVRDSACVGLGLLAGGYTLARAVPWLFPLSRRYWTPSYVLATSGVSVLKYAAGRVAVGWCPAWLTYALSCVGQRSLEVSFYGVVLRKLLKEYGATTTAAGSAWMRGKRCLSVRVGRACRGWWRDWMSDAVLVLGVEGVLVGAAVYLVRSGVRLVYY